MVKCVRILEMDEGHIYVMDARKVVEPMPAALVRFLIGGVQNDRQAMALAGAGLEVGVLVDLLNHMGRTILQTAR